jgi:hypothetical protein
MSNEVKVLFLAADPASMDPRKPLRKQKPRLGIDEEIRAITAMLRGSEHRDSVKLVPRLAARADDFLQALNELGPQVVHFSGHGSQAGCLIVVGRDGTPQPVTADALRGLFRTMGGGIRVVFLNACYSRIQAEAISESIDCVIGMGSRFSDEASIAFAAAFYRALGFGRSVQNAFEQARASLQIENIPEEDTPRLLAREGVDPATVILVTGDDPVARATLAVIRGELRDNLQRLASQISHTCFNVPGGDVIPQRPGETRAQFEDRDRDVFARDVEYVFSLYPQFALEASQRVNLARLDEPVRSFVDSAYAAVREVENRLALYRERLQKGLALYESGRRGPLARLHSRLTANRLSDLWFQILQNWLMLQPDETDISIARLSLAQVLSEPNTLPLLGIPLELDRACELPPLEASREGWRYAQQQRARLQTEKMALDQEIDRAGVRSWTSPADAKNQATSFTDALGRASLAYCEGRPENAVTFLEQALRFDDAPEDQRHFARTSLDFLRNPDAFEGVPGAYLLEVDDAGPAARAGLRKGDVIVRYNGDPVTEPGVLSRLVSQARGAPHVAVAAVRGGERPTVYLRGGASLCAIATALVYVESLAV